MLAAFGQTRQVVGARRGGCIHRLIVRARGEQTAIEQYVIDTINQYVAEFMSVCFVVFNLGMHVLQKPHLVLSFPRSKT